MIGFRPSRFPTKTAVAYVVTHRRYAACTLSITFPPCSRSPPCSYYHLYAPNGKQYYLILSPTAVQVMYRSSRRYNLHFPNHQCPHHLRVPLVTPRTAPSNQSTIPFTVTSRWQSSALGSSPICSLVPNIPRLRAICRRNFLILLHTHSIERNCTLP